MRILRRLVLPLLLLISAPSVFAEIYGEIRTYPAAPTTATPITLSVITTCFADAGYRIERDGSSLLLVIDPRGSCPSPPIAYAVDVPVGNLEAGSYRLSYKFSAGSTIYDIGPIHVRTASNPVPFDIHPLAVPANGGTRMRISRNSLEGLCGKVGCTDVSIRVGGVVVKKVEHVLTPQEVIWFDAPAHAAGLVDVVIERLEESWVYPAAVLYYDAPHAAVFERILFPVLFDAAGANGSRWRSEAVVSNPNPWFVENFNTIESIACIMPPCGERLAPRSYARVTGGHWPHGVLLLVPRGEADGLELGLRVRDVSREAEGFGTELPVVRERDLVLNRPARLLNVPLDPRYRVKVRVYMLDVDVSPAHVQVLNPETGVVKSEYFVPLSRGCEGGSCETSPSYGELDLPAGAPGERVVISVEPILGAPLWAFATVTNNSTQEVTVVTPQ